jgi:hypothetical protein
MPLCLISIRDGNGGGDDGDGDGLAARRGRKRVMVVMVMMMSDPFGCRYSGPDVDRRLSAKYRILLGAMAGLGCLLIPLSRKEFWQISHMLSPIRLPPGRY